eukprot:EG_transcript_1670
MDDPDYRYFLMFAGQFRPEGSPCLDPVDYALNADGRRLVGRINAERNKDALARLAKAPPVSAHASTPFVNYAKQRKCYSEQRKLELTEAERLEIFNIVTSVFEYTNDRRKVVLASHLIIKLFCDMIVTQMEEENRRQGPVLPHSSCQILTFCFKMLRSDYVCVRKHVFELLYNLSIHLNLLHHKTHNVEQISVPTTTSPDVRPVSGHFNPADRLPRPRGSGSSPPAAVPSGGVLGLSQRPSRSPSLVEAEEEAVPPGRSALLSSIQTELRTLSGSGSIVSASGDGSVGQSMSASAFCVERIQAFHRELVWVLHELLHFMVTTEEADDTVWWAACSCWLMMCSNTNEPMRPEVAERYFPFFSSRPAGCHPAALFARSFPTDVPVYVLRQVDVRALRRFLDLRQVRLDHRLHTYFLHLLCMALFLPQDDASLTVHDSEPQASLGRDAPRQADLAVARLASLGGITTIVQLYVGTQSYSARLALFSILYFHAGRLLMAEDPPLKNVSPKYQAEAVWRGYHAMCGHHLPWYLPQVFMYLPPNFVEAVLQHVLLALHQDATDDERRRFQKHTKPWVLAVIFAVRHIATEFLQVEPAFMAEMKTMLVDSDKTQRCFGLLTQLLTSTYADERAQGEAWLFALMKTVFEADKLDATIAAIMSVKQKVEQVLGETLSLNPNPLVRRLFISVTERFILLLKSKFPEFQSPALLEQLHKILNRHFFILCFREERDLDNLLAMYHVLLHYLCSMDAPTPPVNAPQPLQSDTLTDLFLEGAVTVPLDLLVEVELDVLKYLLLTITQQQLLMHKASERPEYVHNPTIHNVRRALMLLVLEHAYHCEASYRSLSLDFFQFFLGDPCPAIGLHASSFILHRIRRAGHDVFRTYFNKALAAAQQENDVELLENQYFLCCLMMDHLTEFPPLPDTA